MIFVYYILYLVVVKDSGNPTQIQCNTRYNRPSDNLHDHLKILTCFVFFDQKMDTFHLRQDNSIVFVRVYI
ncbi:unnamed protein product [marine sediment metagenome]|uniref:Uncharacterized protein n=1 Tax=marine sediment metagenome TaxID=412755 RepID=X0SHV7_9ZZZZ